MSQHGWHEADSMAATGRRVAWMISVARTAWRNSEGQAAGSDENCRAGSRAAEETAVLDAAFNIIM